MKTTTTDKKLTYCDVIEIVAKKYNKKNRAIDIDGVCLYSVNKLPPEDDGSCCAVGMFLDPDKAPKSIWGETIPAPELFSCYGFDNIVKDEVSHLYKDSFWLDLQRFHDKDHHWNKKGLSKEGLKYKNKMLEEWRNK